MIAEIIANPVFMGVIGAGSIGAVLAAVWRYGRLAGRWAVERLSIEMSVTTSQGHDAFQFVSLWMGATAYAMRKARRLHLTYQSGGADDGPGSANAAAPSTRLTLGYGRHVFFSGGKLIYLTHELKEEVGGYPTGHITVRIFLGRRADIEAITASGRRLYMLKAERQRVRVYTPTGWVFAQARIERRIASIDLPDDLPAKILTDAQRFFESEDIYVRRGQPWRRGYLFHGSPGTGKSSMIAALATELNLPVYYIALSAVSSDNGLAESLSHVPARAIVAIEDIDTFDVSLVRDTERIKAPRGNAKERDTLTLSGVLNALDGLLASHGRLLIMTSNRPEDLDPALVRPGRIDVQYAFNPIGIQETRSMLRRFYGVDDGWRALPFGLSVPASVVQSSFEKHPDAIDDGLAALQAALGVKP